jgi:superfamily II DNA or RNA helicase
VAVSIPDPDAIGPLRSWQRHALRCYLGHRAANFTAVATPGAGKTTFALRVAAHLLAAGTVRAVAVVAPTEHLKTQWAAAAARVGIQLDAAFRNADIHQSPDFHGAVVTYAQVGAAPQVHRRRSLARPTLVVLDEIHHAGDSRTWGDAVAAAFTPATRRLLLTGTPFRSDDHPIPFVTYQRDHGVFRSSADSSYGYGEALADGVVRPVIFLVYAGEARWRTSAGEELAARLGEPMTRDLVASAWRTALDPAGDWMPQVLRAAEARLRVVRAGGMPDAAGLVIAGDQAAAHAYGRLLARVSGEAPTVVVSDDAGASAKIGEFARSDRRWLVAVRMVSEGVDIPRLAVGVYATNAATPLYFAQAVGRFVRARRAGETSSVFLPSVPVLLALAAEMEAQRDHVLRPDRAGLDDDELARARRAEPVGGRLARFEALSATAELDQVIFDGATFGRPVPAGTPEEQDYLGIPGLLTPEQVAMLLRRRQAEQVPADTGREQPVATSGAGQRRLSLRRQLNALVAAHHLRAGTPHGKIHAELRQRCGGPPSAQATIAQLEARIVEIRTW